ncbi:MAG: FecR domain-containing protein, partial [Opitutaceae bacterium]
MNESRLEALLESYIDDRLTPAEKAELEGLLLNSAAAREAFWARLGFEGVLEEAVDTERIAQWMTRTERAALHAGSGEKQGLWARWTRLMSGHPMLTALGAAAILILALLPPRPVKPGPVVEPTSNGVAVLASSWNVRWDDPLTARVDGSVLPPGRIKISAGVLGIEFYNGARMTLEGPADVELVKVDEVICHAGKLRVQVPHVARNFRVLTDRLDVLDLGTEFGLEAGPDRATEVHVFDGKVAWGERGPPSATAPKEELVAGQAIRMNPAGVSRISARTDEFVSGGVLEQRLTQQQKTRFAAWQDASRRLGEDPRVVMHFDFQRDPTAPRMLRNRAARTGRSLDGVIVGAEWAEGRWTGKGAMEFRQPGDRVRVVVPGEFDALTYVA